MKKQSFLKFTFSAFLFLLFLSCETESLQLDKVQETGRSNVLVEQVDFSAVPELSQVLSDASGKSNIARSYSKKGDSKFWLDEQDVLKLRDSVNNESYTIVIHTDEPSPTTFYNLVVTKRADGNPIVPFVVEYNFNNGNISSFAEDDNKEFDGTVNIYSFTEFSQATGLNSKSGNPVACFQDVGKKNNTVVGNNSSGTSTGSSGGSSTTGSSNTSGTVSVTRPHISVSRTRTRGSVTAGVGRFHMPPLTSNKQTQKTGIVGKEETNVCPEGWVSIPINEIKDIPPSCKSFDFRSTGANWQESSVIGIRFNIFVLQIIGGVRVRKKHTILFTQPVKFGLPRKFANGTTIPSGLAAEIGAKAINHAIDDVISKYHNIVVNSTSVLRSDFQSKLKKEFREFSNGGRVNFNDMTSATRATQYRTYGVIPDNCY
ncbi:hypothetical protein [Spongiimicrobium sp. 3-5]|uniref:hypothetical protein n=1 Tax=Spongiimicrobium sp. 3-5 TaxID=3332596 RepID=UPI00397E9DBB